ncbi:hypothetical protein L1987_02693 [Smallanthus sonchifolius]|uniref:Uncharacterized protein n=1 Tax=Smallanthus sonchifolius TaxID=185202 RepID=A0ACB9K8N0_9ASTR|nr:hypothetical protein L1987_02693 [Smallanthus sonchifolius]
MDSNPQAAVDGGGGRSGGKILKRRTIAARNTPYDRPAPPVQPENPNWRNGLLFPAKFVAGGASKLLSSIWKPKSWGAHSSSESDSDSEVGIEDDYVRDENLPDGDAELNQNKGSSSGKSEILYLIEQLIMLERFSREERDRLIEIIDSRVVDYTMREGMDVAPNDLDISNKAIMEARKIISENMAGTSSKSGLDNSILGSKYLMTPNRDHLSGGSWKIQNEMQRLHSKAIELMKPNEPISLVAPKPGNETVNLTPNDMKNPQDDVPTEALSSLPTTEEQNLIAEEKDLKDDKTGDDANLVEGNRDLITEHAEVADVINVSHGSSNTSDPTSTKAANSPAARRPVTRTRKYNTRRGRGRGK